jgi:23S rRNA pseudouridine1911/1915/1917 synthase
MNKAHTENHVLIVPDELAGMRFDQALANLLSQYSRTAIKQWIEAGAALLNGAPVKPRTAVRGGDHVSLRAVHDAQVETAAQDLDFEVVYDDEHLIVINKPSGLVVHPGAGNPDRTLVNGLLARYAELHALPRAGLVHRIDKDTSGLLLVARTPASYQTLVRAMAARLISRSYETIVNGVLIAGATINANIGRDPQHRTRMRVTDSGRTAVTHFRVSSKFRAHTLLDVQLETGRTHQIRVHLAWHGHPIVGDARYGARPRPPRAATPTLRAALESFPRQALHAKRLELEHPVSGESLRFDATRPSDIEALLAELDQDLRAATQ